MLTVERSMYIIELVVKLCYRYPAAALSFDMIMLWTWNSYCLEFNVNSCASSFERNVNIGHRYIYLIDFLHVPRFVFFFSLDKWLLSTNNIYIIELCLEAFNLIWSVCLLYLQVHFWYHFSWCWYWREYHCFLLNWASVNECV